MNLSDFFDSANDLCSPLALDSGATLHLPSRPPGREAFPLLDGAQLVTSIAAPIRAIAEGIVVQTDPLVIAHRNNLLSLYRWDGSSDVSLGAPVTHGQSVGRIGEGDSLHFEIGVSLYAPLCDPQHFMSLDPRPVLNQFPAPINYDASLWRGSVPLEAIPLFLRRAIVAVEDRRFYDHRGIDVTRICKALLNAPGSVN